MHLQAASVEKDFWICWTLRERRSLLPGIGPHLTFQGRHLRFPRHGNSLSAFPEDIDLVVDKKTLGFAGDRVSRPGSEQKTTQSPPRSFDGSLPALGAGNFAARAGRPYPCRARSHRLEILEVDPDMDDGQCLLFHYPGDFDPTEAGYVRPVVKIELGARSDDWPHQEKLIQPYLAEAFPNLASGAAIAVRVLAAERTFWEKALLLHEETFRPADKPSANFCMARHYYDVWCLITRGVAERAAQDRPLFDRVAAHREIFFRWSWVDYTTLHPGALPLPAARPPRRCAWRKDYQGKCAAKCSLARCPLSTKSSASSVRSRSNSISQQRRHDDDGNNRKTSPHPQDYSPHLDSSRALRRVGFLRP